MALGAGGERRETSWQQQSHIYESMAYGVTSSNKYQR